MGLIRKEFHNRNIKRRVHPFRDTETDARGLLFWCLGCGEPHRICIKQGEYKNSEGNLVPTEYPIWTFNNDFKLPVLSPSVLSYYDVHTRDEAGNIVSTRRHTCCHSFVGINGAGPGQIIYLNDSPHHLSGKIIDLPDFTLRGDWFNRMHLMGENAEYNVEGNIVRIV